MRGSFAVFALLLVIAIGCTPDDGSLQPIAAPPPSGVDAEAVSGTYEVQGVTVQALTGRQRPIQGRLSLDVEGPRYEVSFELSTTSPDRADPTPVHVRGKGRGFVVGGILTGTNEAWMTLEAPIEESAGKTIPSGAGRKIVSSSQGSFDEKGVFQVVLQNDAGADRNYHPSVTVLAGHRIASEASP
ncbi:MAG: hypothetical protein JRG86_01475 [Deltaproteobacteria bacterium]|jgi:hypothetical protein|nr:hypothetical protein [Deltaproteobacteria bacterium]